MKPVAPILAIASGFALTLAVFGGGTAFGTFVLAGKSVTDLGPGPDTAQAWTDAPRRVNTATQDLERLPARQPAPDPEVGFASNQVNTEDAPASIDTMTTASIRSRGADAFAAHDLDREPAYDPELVEAHIEWCANRYRSYRPRDDSYTPYSGGRRPCVSPYSEALDGSLERGAVIADTGEGGGESGNAAPVTLLGYAADDAGGRGWVDSDHVANCFSRYRSYRPEDNTYQPYGGGPRRQCR